MDAMLMITTAIDAQREKSRKRVRRIGHMIDAQRK